MENLLKAQSRATIVGQTWAQCNEIIFYYVSVVCIYELQTCLIFLNDVFLLLNDILYLLKVIMANK